MSPISEANSLQRITIQITKSQYELLKEYGPYPWQDVFALMEAESGKEIRNQYYRLIKNRDSLLLVANKIQKQASLQIDKSICAIELPIPLSFSVLNRSDVMNLSDASRKNQPSGPIGEFVAN